MILDSFGIKYRLSLQLVSVGMCSLSACVRPGISLSEKKSLHDLQSDVRTLRRSLEVRIVCDVSLI